MSVTRLEAREIPGTTIFDGKQALKGYQLNEMCYSFNDANCRDKFLQDEDAYCEKFGLTPEQCAAVKSRKVLQLIETGGNIKMVASRKSPPRNHLRVPFRVGARSESR